MEAWRKRKREPAPPGCISVSIFFPRFLPTPCACVQRGDSRGRCDPTERWRQPPKPDLRRSSSLSPGRSCKSSKCRVHARRQRGRDAPRRWLRQCHREVSRPQHASNTRPCVASRQWQAEQNETTRDRGGSRRRERGERTPKHSSNLLPTPVRQCICVQKKRFSVSSRKDILYIGIRYRRCGDSRTKKRGYSSLSVMASPSVSVSALATAPASASVSISASTSVLTSAPATSTAQNYQEVLETNCRFCKTPKSAHKSAKLDIKAGCKVCGSFPFFIANILKM